MSTISPLGPAFRTAQAAEIAVVHSNSVVPETTGKNAKNEIQRRRAAASDIGSQATLRETILGQPEQQPINSWDDLLHQTFERFDAYIDSRDLSSFADARGGPYTSPSVEDARELIKDLAGQGIMTTAAFLEVQAKVLAKESEVIEDPGAKLLAIAQGSKSFMMEWAKLDGKVDAALAASLSSEPQDIDEVFSVPLHFDEKWFSLQDGKVILDPAEEGNLRFKSVTGKLNPNYPPKVKLKHPSKEDIPRNLYACPAIHLIPYIYQHMLTQAHEAGLLESTFAAAQQTHTAAPEVRELALV